MVEGVPSYPAHTWTRWPVHIEHGHIEPIRSQVFAHRASDPARTPSNPGGSTRPAHLVHLAPPDRIPFFDPTFDTITKQAARSTMAYQFITHDSLDDGRITRITLNRPAARNAQNRGLLVELGAAFDDAEQDDRVRVVILCGSGQLFSAGHDLGSEQAMLERTPGPDMHPSYRVNGGTKVGAEQRMRQEWHYFFQNTLRWRNLRKVTIAQVHGPVYAAGLMLMWCCDLITAAEDTTFADVVGTRLGMCGLEYFAHPWEFGPRKAKELLLTGDSLGVDDAYNLGMVTKVFSEDDLASLTIEFAQRIAALPSMT